MFSWTLVTLATLAINLAAAAPAPWKDKDTVNKATYTGSGGQSGGGSVAETNDNSLLGQVIGRPVFNGWSGNAGNGGLADSGPAFVSGEGLNGHGKFPQTKSLAAYSGSGGDAEGGSSTVKSALINLSSSNGGNGGSSESGLSDVGNLAEVLPGL